MKRDFCGSCGATLHKVLDLGLAPLADEFPHTPNASVDRYPLQLAVCHDTRNCGLAQLTEVVDDELLWGGDYAFYAGAVAPVVEYMARYAKWLDSNYGLLMRNKLVVEIGCNDGTLLAALRELGHLNSLGVDPAEGPAQAANDRGLPVLNAKFGVVTAEQIIDEDEHGRKAALIVANNVAAHVADLDDFFTGIKTLLAPYGVAILEVQYLPDLLLGNDFTLLYHEHRSYFSLITLRAVARQRGLAVRDAWLTTPQGGSLRVALTHPETPGHPALSVGTILAQERDWLTWDSFQGLQGRADRLLSSLLQLVFDEHAAGRRVAGYGASAKATTLLSWTGLGRMSTHPQRGVHPGTAQGLAYVVDTSPSKIGRYMPGTSIPVVGSGELDPEVTHLVMIWNYLGHVIRKEADYLTKGGRFIVPFPKPVLL
jgi:SAM-dependent methyltransferase